MFSALVRVALLALAVSASAVAAAPSLSLKVTGSDVIDGIEDFKVVAILTNTGDETIKLLNNPRSALHTLSANAFVITASDGSSPSFTGVSVKYSFDNAMKMTDPSIFTVLAPGQSVSVTHDLSSAYDFTRTGRTTYTIVAPDLFHFVTVDNIVSSLRAAASPHTATLASGALALTRPLRDAPRVTKRAQYTGCNSTQQDALNKATPAAQKYVADALAYLENDQSTVSRYTTWFGAVNKSRLATVHSHFASINSHQYTSFTYDCTCTNASLISYVVPDVFGVIHLCAAFWDASATGSDSQAGTLVQQASIFDVNGGSRNFVSGGASDARSLAQSDPDVAIFNANNHQYFAEDGQS
ncbi:hypothetical protein V8D89_002238 [Ganoderma adspersum]